MTDDTTATAIVPVAEGWDGILEPGERILWQGRSDGRIRWGDMVSVQTVFGVVFTAFAVFWITGAASMMSNSRMSSPGIFAFFPLFGIPFVLVGLNMVIGRHLTDAWTRRNTHNTLTDRAAYVASKAWGRRRLERTGYDEMTMLELEDGDPGSVWFGEKVTTHSTSRRQGRRRHYTHRRKLGFREVTGARQVFGALRSARGKTGD